MFESTWAQIFCCDDNIYVETVIVTSAALELKLLFYVIKTQKRTENSKEILIFYLIVNWHFLKKQQIFKGYNIVNNQQLIIFVNETNFEIASM